MLKIIILLFLSLEIFASDYSFITYGVSFYTKLDEGIHDFRFGLEVSYWNYPDRSPIRKGACVGVDYVPSLDAYNTPVMDFTDANYVFYAQAQVNFMILGSSIGPSFSFGKDHFQYGFQADPLWLIALWPVVDPLKLCWLSENGFDAYSGIMLKIPTTGKVIPDTKKLK